MNMCQPVTSKLHRRRLRALLLCVAASSFHRRRQSVTVHAALLSLGRQREMCYVHHYATTNSLSFRRQLKTELYTSTLVTVFTVRVGERNFIALTYLLTLRGPAPRGHHLAEKLLYPKRVLYHI